jgi:hypothetical protein
MTKMHIFKLLFNFGIVLKDIMCVYKNVKISFFRYYMQKEKNNKNLFMNI